MSTGESIPALFVRPIGIFEASRGLELSASLDIRVCIKIFE
jgi:hypothetical protein